MSINALHYRPGEAPAIIGADQLLTILQSEGVTWVDLDCEPVEESQAILQEIFNFHPLAIDDALRESHVPKVDDWGEYLYVVLHAVTFDSRDGGEVETSELDIFLGNQYMVTFHDRPIPAVARTWELCLRDERHLRNGASHLLYRLADEIVASYMPVVDEMDAEIDRAETEIFGQTSSRTLERIFTLKRAVLKLRRMLGPEREVLNKLARDDYAVIDPRSRIYFRDIYDHLVRLHDITESIRDLIGGTLDTYLSMINNRMNEVMKTLTIITTFFMPLSFIVGFFGMNFFLPQHPVSSWVEMPVFRLALLVMVLAPFWMFWWLRRRGWM